LKRDVDRVYDPLSSLKDSEKKSACKIGTDERLIEVSGETQNGTRVEDPYVSNLKGGRSEPQEKVKGDACEREEEACAPNTLDHAPSRRRREQKPDGYDRLRESVPGGDLESLKTKRELLTLSRKDIKK